MILKPNAEIVETFKIAGPVLIFLFSLIIPTKMGLILNQFWLILARLAKARALCITLIIFSTTFSCLAIYKFSYYPQPAIQDEFSYLLASDTFSSGRLTNPTHPMWVYFETFYVNHQPTYMAKYPPAQGLFLALGNILTGHAIVGVAISSALMCAAIYWMLLGYMPPRWALLGSLIAILHLGICSYWAQSYWGGAVAAMGGCLVYGGLRRTIAKPNIVASLLLGSGLGILAISRPFEGFLVSIPALIALMSWLISSERTAYANIFQKFLIPFLLMLSISFVFMGYYNWRVSGTPWIMPYQIHEETYNPIPVFIWQQPRAIIGYHHKLLHDFYEDLLLWYLSYYRSPKSILIGSIIKFKVFWLFFLGTSLTIPLSTIYNVLKDRWMKLALAGFLLVFIGFLLTTFTHSHYLAPATGPLFLLLTQSMRHFYNWQRLKRLGKYYILALPIFLLTLLVMRVSLDLVTMDSEVWVNYRAELAQKFENNTQPSLLIVRYGQQHLPGREWIFNRADIDRAKVVWARDMDNNCELIHYFKERQVFLVEIDDDELSPIIRPYPVNLCH